MCRKCNTCSEWNASYTESVTVNGMHLVRKVLQRRECIMYRKCNSEGNASCTESVTEKGMHHVQKV